MKRRWTEHTPVLSHVMALPWWHRAIRRGRTLFEARITEPTQVDRVLISGVNNKKIGSHITRGRLRGAPIFTLTLEERATCPKSCAHWTTCYGNNMNWPKRLVHGKALESRLDAELAVLNEKHPEGFMIRLHVLGDFYSVAYVKRWATWINRYPALHVFGYTQWPTTSPIGKAVAKLRDSNWERFAVRTSNSKLKSKASRTLTSLAPQDDLIVCPVEADKSDCCGTCGLCWTTKRNIGFVLH